MICSAVLLQSSKIFGESSRKMKIVLTLRFQSDKLCFVRKQGDETSHFRDIPTSKDCLKESVYIQKDLKGWLYGKKHCRRRG
jgi:hypothetical protein